jgi:MFS family permease
MTGKSKTFYLFLCPHSLLIGLFPFFIPVYLWNIGLSIGSICFFISLTGLGFCLSLYIWDRVVRVFSFRNIILISFFWEILLLLTLFWGVNSETIFLLGLLNGFYNCFFWVTNRWLFSQTITTENSGKRFGNAQLVITVFFKSGVLLGGYLLEDFGFNTVFMVSVLISVFGILFFLFPQKRSSLPQLKSRFQAIKVSEILYYKDSYRSKLVFSLDGLFLYLESYFWVISLFLIVQQSFWELGLVVIALVVIFSSIYILIKNKIDRLPVHQMYIIGVVLYLLSWLMRSIMDQNLNLPSILLLLVFISFFTSLFRLTFNKRFFDITKTESSLRYIIIKSYYSQFCLALFFAVLGGFSYFFKDSELFFRFTYWMAAFLSSIYLFYRPLKIKNDSKNKKLPVNKMKYFSKFNQNPTLFTNEHQRPERLENKVVL